MLASFRVPTGSIYHMFQAAVSRLCSNLGLAPKVERYADCTAKLPLLRMALKSSTGVLAHGLECVRIKDQALVLMYVESLVLICIH